MPEDPGPELAEEEGHLDPGGEILVEHGDQLLQRHQTHPRDRAVLGNLVRDGVHDGLL